MTTVGDHSRFRTSQRTVIKAFPMIAVSWHSRCSKPQTLKTNLQKISRLPFVLVWIHSAGAFNAVLFNVPSGKWNQRLIPKLCIMTVVQCFMTSSYGHERRHSTPSMQGADIRVGSRGSCSPDSCAQFASLENSHGTFLEALANQCP